MFAKNRNHHPRRPVFLDKWTKLDLNVANFQAVWLSVEATSGTYSLVKGQGLRPNSKAPPVTSTDEPDQRPNRPYGPVLGRFGPEVCNVEVDLVRYWLIATIVRMKIPTVLFTTLCLLVTSCASTYEETVTFSDKDMQNWGTEFTDLRRAGSTVEFVPPGQTVKDWSEMFTIQIIKRKDISPTEAIASMRERIKGVCPDVSFLTIARGPYSSTYEFWTLGNETFDAQHELGRFLVGDEGLHRVAYAKKVPRMDAATRANWLAMISESVVFDVNNRKPLRE